MADRPDESGFELWAGLKFDVMATEIWAVDTVSAEDVERLMREVGIDS